MRFLHATFSAAVFGCLLTAPAALAADGENTKLNLSADEPATQAAQSGGGSIVRTIFGLAVVLGVIYGLHWVLKQVKKSKDAASSGPGLETIATLNLAPNRALHLVRAGGEIVLVGTSENSVTPIRRYTEDEARSLGLLDPAPARLTDLQPLPTEAPKGFMNALRAKTVVK
jgi:flagellar protein FliO/FliZ